MFKASDLSVGYGKKVLIDGINISCEPGKIITLIGPNGSGKSTVLKTIVKQLEASGGNIFVCGKDILKESNDFSAKHISMLMTERIHPELMTAREIIATGRYPYTGRLGILTKDDWLKVDEAVKTVHCEQISEKDFNSLSDGQKQRVMLARAICQDTEIIVLDEPTSFLDMKYKLELLKILKGLAADKNKIIILSLHELDLARVISDQVICLNGEKVIKQGKVEEIFKDDFLQRLYGINENEFNPATGMLVWNDLIQKKKKQSQEKNAQKRKAKILMVQGTMSNAGKSLLVAGLCRLFKQDGYRVAPFKSQNMALNSYITKDGLEMGRAQVMQAEACGIEPDVLMNPILLKPTTDSGSQVIVNGEVLGNMSAREYFSWKKNLVPEILKAFRKLEDVADIIVIEGAGSPAEINLRENDIVNMGLAEMVDAPVLLVGDIDRGGVFAQLLGTIDLLELEERKRVKGLVINKFRGDKTLLDSGIKMLEEKSGIPVTGVLPYMKIMLDDEDSLSENFGKRKEGIVNIGIVKFPRISNFTDFNVFDQIEGVAVHYITMPEEIEKMDMMILPGSKNTVSDMKWMRETGFESAIKKFSQRNIVFGICGGYQMLGKSIADPDGIEEGETIRGLELLDIETILEKEKKRLQVQVAAGEISGPLKELSGKKITGYEIHNGRTTETSGEKFPGGSSKENIYGSYIHGFFDEKDVAFTVADAAAQINGKKLEGKPVDYKAFKETQYDLLASEIRKHLDVEAIYEMLG